MSRADERICEEVTRRLNDDADLDNSGIEVTVEDGEVTLEGTVTSRGDKHRAEEHVLRVDDGVQVFNHLRIEAPPHEAVSETGLKGGTTYARWVHR
jgi:osmotically-inducible protein OsmY